jgi:prepilin-type N-terminal cleavage/methylation domain-containing protein
MVSRVRARLESTRLRRRSRQGFTFVETIVVVAVLGIVAAAVTFTVWGIQPSSTTAECVVNANALRSAVGAYRATNGGGATPSVDDLRAAGLLERSTPQFRVHYSGVDVQLSGTGACSGLGD